MTQSDTLRNTVAEFFRVEPATVGAEFALTGPRLGNSIARGQLDAAIRRQVGARLASVHSARTFGELESELLGKPVVASGQKTERSPKPLMDSSPATGSTRCGIDIERVDSLPKTTDYWEHEFFRTHFSAAEIAYCLMQSNPPIHFAGRWCAKEALKKCDPRFLTEEMVHIEVVTESGGILMRHLVGGHAEVLPHALSISHTSTAAVAVVILGGRPNPPVAVQTAPAAVSPAPVAHFGYLPALGLSIIAAVTALAALFRTFHGR